MNSTLVSIIVPVYNAEKTLQQCVDSIIRQTYTNIEIILIDDGSKDKSRDICDAYSEKDNRVIVYHSYNGGPGKSRNIGIDLATGKYLCFVDADDYVDEKEIEVLVEIIEQRGLDCIQFGFRYFENDIVSEKCVVSDVFPIDEVIYHDDIVDNLPHILRGGTYGLFGVTYILWNSSVNLRSDFLNHLTLERILRSIWNTCLSVVNH